MFPLVVTSVALQMQSPSYAGYAAAGGIENTPTLTEATAYGYGYPGSQDLPSWAPAMSGYSLPPPGFMPPPYGIGAFEPQRGPDGAAVVPTLPQRPSGAYQLDPKVAAVEVLAPDAVRRALDRHDRRGLESATIRSVLDPRAALYEERKSRPRHDAAVSTRAAAAAEDDIARARAVARRQNIAEDSEEDYQRARADVQLALDRAKKLQGAAELFLAEDHRSIRSAMGSTLRADPVQKIVAKWAQ